ncbi:MAG: helix-turn-helix transcriptional regulator [Blastocatellales bacterium]|nr:helix-turn-helix transcriptional regulator [Blastocatellales bacterium]
MTALRKSKGWTQSELGARLGLTQKMVDYYERRAVNPSLALIEQAAALKVSVAELLATEPQTARRKPGPASQLELRLERIKRLPRKDQEFVIRFLDTILERSEQV